jgi:hypothetical protein
MTPYGPPQELYRTPPPWEIGRPQPAFRALADAGRIRGRVLTARFLHHDALRLGELGERFGTVLDSLVFHTFGDRDRATYVDSLRSVLRPGGIDGLVYPDPIPAWLATICWKEPSC